MICMQKLVKVDGQVRTEINYPAGFMGASEVAGSSAARPNQYPCPHRLMPIPPPHRRRH